MLDPVIEFFKSVFHMIGSVIGKFILIMLSPFIFIRNLYRSSGWILKGLIAILVLCILIPYSFFFWNSLWVRGYDLNYTAELDLTDRKSTPGERVTIDGGSDTGKTCGPSAIIDVSRYLIDFNVNQNSWMSGWLVYKLGLFGIPWDATPWMDNKATFQRGVHRGVTSAVIEMRETLGRIRGSSERDKDLNDALSNMQIDEFNWYFGLNPVGFKQTSWGSYRQAYKELGEYNTNLSRCEAFFDARADNLSNFLDRIAKDIGSTTAVIKDRAEQHNWGWFDTRADNVFMEANGQLYAYLGLLRATRQDFSEIVERRNLDSLWDTMDAQLASAVQLSPLVISNGDEDGFIMPTHLTTMGFYILRVRTNLTEMRDVLKN
ncbi:MAG: DUF2333 family protein [Pseudomonadota bacterium]